MSAEETGFCGWLRSGFWAAIVTLGAAGVLSCLLLVLRLDHEVSDVRTSIEKMTSDFVRKDQLQLALEGVNRDVLHGQKLIQMMIEDNRKLLESVLKERGQE